MVTLIGFLVIGLFIAGIVVAVRVLTLPGEVRAVTERMASMERELRSVESRLEAARARIDQLEGGAAPKTPAALVPGKAEPSIAAMAVPPLPQESEWRIPPPVSMEREVAKVTKEVIAPGPDRDVVPPPLPVTPSRSAPLLDEEPAESAFGTWLKSIGPKDPNMTWEVALGTYWLPRLGALAISTAMVFALTIAFQRWGAPARVAMGYGVAAAFLGFGWWLDRKYPKYARVLFGAGFALTYFVTFATYFVEFAKIFDTPYLTLAGLAAIVVAWAALAQRRQSPVIAAVAMLVGQFTIALATYSIEDPGPYSILGIVFLSVGGAFFLARNGWYFVAGLGLVASYANHFYLMTQVKNTGTVAEFVTGMAVLSTYFLVYAAAEFLSPDTLRRGRVPFWFRNAFATFNSVVFLLYGTMTMQGFDFAREEIELFYYSFAAVLLGFSIAYLRLRDADPLYNTYFVKGISAATLGLAFQFDAHTLTVSFALESAILLFAARRTGLVVTRIVALGAGALAVVHGSWVLLVSDSVSYGAEGYWPRVIEAGAIVGALLGAALLYQRTDWSTRSPARTRFGDAIDLALWQLDLLAAPPASESTARKPADGLLFPILFSFSAACLFIGHAYWLTASGDWPLALAAAAAVLTVGAALLRTTPFGVAAFALFATAVFTSLPLREFRPGGLWDANAPSAPAIPILALLAVVALASEKRYFGRFTGLALHQKPSLPFVLYGAFTALLGLYLAAAFASAAWAIGALLIATVVFAAAAIPLHRLALTWCSTALIAWAAFRWNIDWHSEATNGFLVAAWIGIAVAFALERYFARLGVKYAGDALVAVAACFFVPYVFREVPREWIALGWAAGAAVLLAYGGFFRGRTAVVLGLVLLMVASLRQVIYVQEHAAGTWPILLGFAVPAVLWIGVERTTQRVAARMNLAISAPAVTPLCGLAAGIATALLVLMLYRLPQLAEYYLTISWSVLAMTLFGLAIGVRERLYRYCGLAVLALASLRVVLVDTRELELIQKVLAWGGLGIVLLILGFGYAKVFARTSPEPSPPDLQK